MSSESIYASHELAILKSIDASMDIFRSPAKGPELTPWQEGWNAYGMTVRDRKFAARKWFRALPPEMRETVGELLSTGHIQLVPTDEGLQTHVNCNDLFHWATSDSEEVGLDEVASLAYAIGKDPKWGAAIWACKKRGQPPQAQVADDMKDDGAWDDALEALQKLHRELC